jgi:hypothetical protein
VRQRINVVVVALALLVLSACHVDATIDVVVNADGSGTVTLTLVADAELVSKAPGLADDLRFDDAVAAGWTVDGPTATSDGGLQVVISQSFDTPEQATVLLQSINGPNGPLHDVAVVRTVTDEAVSTVLSGTMRVDGGLDAFADPEVLAAIGGAPYAADIAAANMRPSDAVTVTLRAQLPGSITSSTGTADGGTLVWTVPIDATQVQTAATATQSRGGSNAWSILSTASLVLLVAWCLLAIAFIAFVVTARRRRAQRRTSGAPRAPTS